MSIQIDADKWWRRTAAIRAAWQAGRGDSGSPWAGVDAVLLLAGKPNDEGAMRTQDMAMIYCLGFLFTDTLIALTNDALYVMASPKKLSYLKPLQAHADAAVTPLHLLERNKEQTHANFERIISKIRSSMSGMRVAMLRREKATGTFASSFNEAIQRADGLEFTELSHGLAGVMAVKEKSEVNEITAAAKLSTTTMRHYFVDRMETIIDKEQKISQSTVAEEVDNCLSQPKGKMLKKFGKQVKDFEEEWCEVSFSTIVQSGGEYNLSPAAETNDKPLSYDTIVCSLGAQYKDYTSHLARTYFVDPTDNQKAVYESLLLAQEACIAALRPGAEIRAGYHAARAVLSKNGGTLHANLTKNCGWGMGLGFRDTTLLISSKNTRLVREGMVFTVCIGLHGLELSQSDAAKLTTVEGGKWSCLLADTVVVGAKENETLTLAKKEYSAVSYNIANNDSAGDEDDDEDDAEEEAADTAAPSGRPSLRSSRKTKEQIQAESEARNAAQKMYSRQQQLMLDKAKEAERTATLDSTGDETGGAAQKVVAAIKSYNAASEYPAEISSNKIFCDVRKESVLLPIGGMHVPFHVSTIKSISKNDEESASFLRFNFYYPTGSFARDLPPAMRAAIEQYPHMAFVKEMSFRSRDARNLNHQLRLIKELQKRVRARQKERDEKADLVEQLDLIPMRDQRPPSLDDISMRPSLRKGKCTGRLQAHTNGLRFRTNRGEVLDIIYANVKHFFYQACKNELTVLIHFNLKHPIMVGKNKTYNVQFFTEVVEGSTALDGKRRSMFDPDEIDEEHRERQLRKKLNAAFKNFSQQVVQTAERHNQVVGYNNEVDIPYYEMRFSGEWALSHITMLQTVDVKFSFLLICAGVPFKEMVALQPTVNCLVNLSETPPFVVSLDEVDHIHFERVDLGRSKNFDMVLILKSNMDLDSETLPHRIQSIEMRSLDTIKEWIDQKGDMTFTFGTMAMNWKGVMLGVRDELSRQVFWKDRFEDGSKKDIGWNFLSVVGDDSDDEEPSDDESDFSAPDEQVFTGDDESEEDDWDMDEEESEEEEEEEDSDGPSWEDLEREAAASDRIKRGAEEERDARPKKKRRGR